VDGDFLATGVLFASIGLNPCNHHIAQIDGLLLPSSHILLLWLVNREDLSWEDLKVNMKPIKHAFWSLRLL
jgi:hypothetical protein